MKNQSATSSIFSNMFSLALALILGLTGYAVFYFLIKQGHVTNELVLRYFAGHTISHVVTGMFCIGVAALAMKAVSVTNQYSALDAVQLQEPPEDGQQVEDCQQMLDSLAGLPPRLHDTYLWQRLRDAIQYVSRKQSSEGLDDELKYLADQDVARQQESYSLVRIMIWATPMLGFLGTVIGITIALEEFGRQDLGGENLKSAMDVLLGGLYIAFDTTALALSLSVVMMFMQFMIDRFETQLLAGIDARVNHEMVGRFSLLGGSADPHVRSIERMGQSVIRTTEQLVQRQSEVLQTTVEAAHEHWSGMTDTTSQLVKTALVEAIDETLERHSTRMDKIEQTAAEQVGQRWQQWQTALAENAKVMYEQQKQLVQQGEIMTQAVETTGEVMKLEAALNSNLSQLAGSKNFEDTVMSLSAAIHLLTTRLDQTDPMRQVALGNPESQERAA